MSEETEQLPSQAATAAALPEEAQPNNAEEGQEETGARVMINNDTDPGTIGGSSDKKSSERKEYLESLVTSGLHHQHQQQQQDHDNIKDGKNKNEHNTTNNNNIIEAFYNIAWPILESEGGWTMVRFELFLCVNVLFVFAWDSVLDGLGGNFYIKSVNLIPWFEYMKFHVILVRFNESKLIDGEKSFDFANLLYAVPLDLLLFDTNKK